MIRIILGIFFISVSFPLWMSAALGVELPEAAAMMTVLVMVAGVGFIASGLLSRSDATDSHER